MTIIVAAGGCAQFDHVRRAPDEAFVIQGPAVTDNSTPLASSFVCVASKIKETRRPPFALTVGNVRDYTGKFSEADGGNPITQGGALMVMSALGKLGDSIRLRERFDVQVAEIELAYLSKRYLGDGQQHVIRDNGKGSRSVPWLPYLGGSILDSDFFIVGGITELNYNIQSGGAELRIDNAGPKARLFTINVAADLRIVNSKTLEVEKTTSLQKQVVGYEVDTEIFQFFGSILVDWNAGVKSQEPLQMAVRATLELAVLELVAHVTNIDYLPCVSFYRKDLPNVEEASAQSGNGAAQAAGAAPADSRGQAATANQTPSSNHPKIEDAPIDRIAVLDQCIEVVQYKPVTETEEEISDTSRLETKGEEVSDAPRANSVDDEISDALRWIFGADIRSEQSSDSGAPMGEGSRDSRPYDNREQGALPRTPATDRPRS